MSPYAWRFQLDFNAITPVGSFCLATVRTLLERMFRITVLLIPNYITTTKHAHDTILL